MKILAVTGNDDEKARISKIFGKDVTFTLADEAEKELEKNNYDFIISAPDDIIVKKRILSVNDLKSECIDTLYKVFSVQNGSLEERLRAVNEKITVAFPDALEAEMALREILLAASDRVFEQNEWLELYISHDIFTGTSVQLSGQLNLLYREFTELYPKPNDKAAEVIGYILNNPESDLKQKTIAQKLYINSSYLSTVFAAQTGMRFVDYLTAVKLKRAAYLLMNTTLSVSEIAERLDYKDIGYFSRLFKTRFGMPPSQYRIPYSYTYEI